LEETAEKSEVDSKMAAPPGAEQRQNEAGREQVPNQFGMRQIKRTDARQTGKRGDIK